ncbi:hypothetical protein HWV00_15730 [Moritella sp. 24]|uniref:DUF4344 domain-containing metallopeptidase n=1 Tax=Moritella sp. 24 TaxID=2746230 RepID=UPI001BA7144F|nr:DUF4344 domain-containing metallopeptidase [Moritella sp. 24]QUM77545.1 hypothetical protein HWV00_15730 [Moritella sp. 24]
MRYYQRWWLFVVTLIISSVSLADNVVVRYDNPSDTRLQSIAEKLKADLGIQDTIALMNEQFIFPEPLTIVFGGRDGPLYDPQRNHILMPYTFLNDVERRFIAVNDASTNNADANVTQAVMDVVIHTLFHELAHALIANHELPIVGKEEDAADNLAAVLSIEYFENGAEIAISAAELFYLEGDDIEEFEDADFWDEHSLDLQRYYATLCHVYGSDEVQYAYLLEETGFSPERGDFCIAEYENIANNWLTLLAPYMTPDTINEPEKDIIGSIFIP